MHRQLPPKACVWGRVVHKQESLEQLLSPLTSELGEPWFKVFIMVATWAVRLDMELWMKVRKEVDSGVHEMVP